ncbi:hypothetical protein NDU88_008888 [Pleurodeles waltl]|uniref:Uncharacterized protein n=1 Tax=Pleurodeles waltl TaxID=8319 RepID=A0AAV7RTR1_PLEWA|nr:hypothetical protein NDU88_008888 [Pleurodeles waltl]
MREPDLETRILDRIAAEKFRLITKDGLQWFRCPETRTAGLTAARKRDAVTTVIQADDFLLLNEQQKAPFGGGLSGSNQKASA